MSQSRRSRHCAFEAVAGHLLMFTDLQSLRVGVVLMSDTPFHCHTMYFRSKLCPCLFEKKKKYTVCTEFGDETPRSASLESGSLDVYAEHLCSSEMHSLWIILLVFKL